MEPEKTNIQNLLIVVGPSGTGKTTLINELMKKYKKFFSFSVSHTTRNIREGETDSVNYYFISKEEFKKMIESDDFIEYNFYSDNFYGTSKTQLKNLQSSGKIVILDIDINGAKNILKSGLESNFISVLPPTIEDLKDRLISRNKDTMETINKRLEISKIEMEEIEKADFFYDKLINKDIVDAHEKFEKVVLELYPHLKA